MTFIQGPPSDPLDAPGVGRELFNSREAERKRLAGWYTEARGVLESVVAANYGIDKGMGQRARKCLDARPFLDDVSES